MSCIPIKLYSEEIHWNWSTYVNFSMCTLMISPYMNGFVWKFACRLIIVSREIAMLTAVSPHRLGSQDSCFFFPTGECSYRAAKDEKQKKEQKLTSLSYPKEAPCWTGKQSCWSRSGRRRTRQAAKGQMTTGREGIYHPKATHTRNQQADITGGASRGGKHALGSRIGRGQKGTCSNVFPTPRKA